MGWLDLNEYLLIEAITRERIDDLRSTVDLTTVESTDGITEPPRDVPKQGRVWRRYGAVNSWRLPRKRRSAHRGWLDREGIVALHRDEGCRVPPGAGVRDCRESSAATGRPATST